MLMRSYLPSTTSVQSWAGTDDLWLRCLQMGDRRPRARRGSSVGWKVEGVSSDETWVGGIRQPSRVHHSENCNTGSGHRSHQFAMYSITRTLAPSKTPLQTRQDQKLNRGTPIISIRPQGAEQGKHDSQLFRPRMLSVTCHQKTIPNPKIIKEQRQKIKRRILEKK